MHTFRTSLVSSMTLAVLISSLPCSAAPTGQTASAVEERHVVDSSLLQSAIAARAAEQDADRAAIRAALARPEIQQAARQLGVDLTWVNESIATLGAADLERAAGVARQVNQSPSGGASTIVISTTTVILALLLLILLVLILR